MIDLAGVPVRAADRRPEHPLVVIGGHCRVQPGAARRLRRRRRARRRRGGRRRDHRGRRGLDRAAGAPTARRCCASWPRSPACTCPSLYDVDVRRPAPRRRHATLRRRAGRPSTSGRSPTSAQWPYPKHQLVPLTEVVHDRLSVEVFRGCTRGCRFCQAGMITRPVRERPAEQVRTMVADGLRRTGYDEVSLTSLSTADFSGIDDVVGGILADRAVSAPGCPTTVNLPSLRVDAFTVGLAGQVAGGRRSGLTFAPEAGSWRLRTRDQQADHRGRPVRRRRRRLRRRLDADQAVLPHRPADRDRRRHAGHRRAGPQLRGHRPPPRPAGRR